MYIVSSSASPHSLGKRPWNYTYTQAFRHQQVILMQCMRVISQVCLQAHSTLYSTKKPRDSIWEFYFWIQGIRSVLKCSIGSKHKVFLLKLTWLPTQAWNYKKSLSLFLFPVSYPFSHKNCYFVFFSSISVTSINYTLSLLSSSYKEPFKIFNRCTILLHLHFHWLRTQK